MSESKSLGMVSKRRNKYDIIADVLKIARPRKKKTHIMFEAKLSPGQNNEYITFLVLKGLLEKELMKAGGRTITFYRTTQKGTDFLEHLEAIRGL